MPNNLAYQLIQQNNHLELQFADNNFGKPLYIDFEKSRYQKVSRQELLLKAIGLKKDYTPSVIDLTAGLGSDAYLLYRAGCKLQCVERSAIIAALLADGLKRVQCDIPLYVGEAKDYLQECKIKKQFPDVIYFDPIFPEKNKTALARKSARILRAVVGDDMDASEVFTLAQQVAKKRVVVKRPKHGALISKQQPDIVFAGQSIRFDVYLRLSAGT